MSQHPLKTGDVCMVVRDLHNPVGDKCHGAIIGTPVTLGERYTATPITWNVAPMVCPICKCPLTFVFSDDLQKLRGPKPAAGAERLVNVNEDGHGRRVVDSEATA